MAFYLLHNYMDFIENRNFRIDLNLFINNKNVGQKLLSF